MRASTVGLAILYEVEGVGADSYAERVASEAKVQQDWQLRGRQSGAVDCLELAVGPH
jgi:hypothetical protein